MYAFHLQERRSHRSSFNRHQLNNVEEPRSGFASTVNTAAYFRQGRQFGLPSSALTTLTTDASPAKREGKPDCNP
jgi:hypothetical protein